MSKVYIEKRCICGVHLKTGLISKEEADAIGRKWNSEHSGAGHRLLSESAFEKLFPDKTKDDSAGTS